MPTDTQTPKPGDPQSEQAGTTAEQAGTTAEQAGTTAEQAGTTAEQARTTAEQAGTTAEQARTTAEQAGTTAEQAGADPVATSQEPAAEASAEGASSGTSPDDPVAQTSAGVEGDAAGAADAGLSSEAGNSVPTPVAAEAEAPAQEGVAPDATAAQEGSAQVTSPTEAGSAAGQAAGTEAPDGKGQGDGSAAGQAAGTEAPDGKGQGDGAAAASEGAPGAGANEGASSGKKRRRRRKKKPAGGDRGAVARGPERAPFQVGEDVFGHVTAVLEHAIMVDLSGKALAILDRTEMEPDDLVPNVGDRFVAGVLRDGARGGLIVLSRKPLREEETRPKLVEASTSGELVQGLITGVIKGGLEVSIGGVRAFAPASGIDLHPQNANFTALLGQLLPFKVSQCDAKARDVVVTRRPMLESEAHERRKEALGLLSEGQVVKGVVRTVMDWGAFVALPEASNLEGLVHVNEASHDPRARMQDLFKPGDETEVKILKIDERGKVWLSRKALEEDPWAEAKAKFKPGAVFTGKISRLEPFGAFIQLEETIDGLLHVADLVAAPRFGFKKVEHPKDIVAVGEEIEVVVHNFDVRTRRIALHVALSGEHRDEPRQRIARNASLTVAVVRPEGDAGLLVRVLGATGRSSRGFIPAGQTGTARGTDLRKRFPPGTQLTGKVIDLDPRRMEPKLSLKRQAEDEERRAHNEYRKKLAKEGGFGTLGDLLAQKLR